MISQIKECQKEDRNRVDDSEEGQKRKIQNFQNERTSNKRVVNLAGDANEC